MVTLEEKIDVLEQMHNFKIRDKFANPIMMYNALNILLKDTVYEDVFLEIWRDSGGFRSILSMYTDGEVDMNYAIEEHYGKKAEEYFGKRKSGE